jgi:hypothetical protein
MGVTPVTLNTAKGMFTNGLSAFVIVWVLFNVAIIDVHCILVSGLSIKASISRTALSALTNSSNVAK